MKATLGFGVAFAFVTSAAGANPCFKLPKGFTPKSPGASTVVLVTTTPTPLKLSSLTLSEMQAPSAEDAAAMDVELATLLVQRLRAAGIDAEAAPTAEMESLVYRSKGRICSKPAEAALIQSQAAAKAVQGAKSSALAVRLMVHRRQVVTKDSALVDENGNRPLIYTASGEVHLVDGTGHHLNYLLLVDWRGVAANGEGGLWRLTRSEWLGRLADHIVADLTAGVRVD